MTSLAVCPWARRMVRRHCGSRASRSVRLQRRAIKVLPEFHLARRRCRSRERAESASHARVHTRPDLYPEAIEPARDSARLGRPPRQAESLLSIRATRKPSDAADGTTPWNHRADEEVDMALERSGYGRKWKRWLAIYLAVGAVTYFILYVAFFHHGGGGGGIY